MIGDRTNIVMLASLALELDLDAFVAECPYCVLLPEAVRSGDLKRQNPDGTLLHVGAPVGETTELDMPRVLLLRRRSEVGVASEVSVGRTANTDIVINDYSVSKLHAYFHRVTGEHWELEDADSKNGTMIDEVPLAPGKRVQLRSGQVLQFGRVRLAFWSPEMLHAMLRTGY